MSIENESVIHNLALRHCAHAHAQWQLTILTIEPTKQTDEQSLAFPVVGGQTRINHR